VQKDSQFAGSGISDSTFQKLTRQYISVARILKAGIQIFQD